MESKQKSLIVLKNSCDFQALQKTGRSFGSAPWVLVNYSWNNLGCLRCGWTVPKRVGNAVIRNRLKRWCREFFREQLVADGVKIESSGVDINVVFRHKIGKQFFKELRHEQFKNTLQHSWQNIFRKH